MASVSKLKIKDVVYDIAGKVGPAELLGSLEGSSDVIVDLNSAGDKVEIHLDQIYKDSVSDNIAANSSDINTLKTNAVQSTEVWTFTLEDGSTVTKNVGIKA